jgi:hypothetical protein
VEVDPLVRTIADKFAALPQVMAIAWAGSRTETMSDPGSDIDLYIYAPDDIPVVARTAIVATLADSCEIDNRSFEPGDAWIDRRTGIGVEVMYRTPAWIEDQLERVLVRHEASTGYSTCFWHNVLHSVPVYDRDGWFGRLKGVAEHPYPDDLQHNIILTNHPILRSAMPSYSYLNQLTSALHRRDLVSINHRIAALLASYFDILFAVNRLPHPGEKRLVEWTTRMCPKVPSGFATAITALLASAGSPPTGGDDPVQRANTVIDGLDELLAAENLIKRPAAQDASDRASSRS